MANADPRPPTPYERFVAATKAILSASKKDVEKVDKAWRRKRRRKTR